MAVVAEFYHASLARIYRIAIALIAIALGAERLAAPFTHANIAMIA